MTWWQGVLVGALVFYAVLFLLGAVWACATASNAKAALEKRRRRARRGS